MSKAEYYNNVLEELADEYEIDPNPAPGPKYQAKAGINRIPKLCGGVQSLMACLIDHTHEEWGFAFPSRKRIQVWTGRSKWAIDRAIAKAKDLGLIRTIERRLRYDLSASTIFITNWAPFFAAYRRVEKLKCGANAHDVARNVMPDAGAKTLPAPCKNAPARCENADHNPFSYPFIMEPDSSPGGEPNSFEKQKGHPGGASCEAERNDQLTAEPKGFNSKRWWMDRLIDTQARSKTQPIEINVSV